MPPNKSVGGLQRVNGEWIKDMLTFEPLSDDWAISEASNCPWLWQDERAHLHALRRMAILADSNAIKLLLKLRGSDQAKHQQLRELIGNDPTVDRVNKVVESVQAYMGGNPPSPPPLIRECCYDPTSSNDGPMLTSGIMPNSKTEL